MIESLKAYGRGVLKGISTWLYQRRDWTIAIDERGLDDPASDWLARRRPGRDHAARRGGLATVVAGGGAAGRVSQAGARR